MTKLFQVVEADEEGGDVVAAPVGEGFVHEFPSGGAGGVGGEDVCDVVVIEHVGEAVGAEEIEVAGGGVEGGGGCRAGRNAARLISVQRVSSARPGPILLASIMRAMYQWQERP